MAHPVTARRRAPGVLLSRLSGPLNALLTCGIARRAADDVIELRLDEEEADQGGMVAIAMRVPARCGACAAQATARCALCSGDRVIDALFSAWLAVPPDVADGTVLMPSAQLPGVLRPVSFRVRLR